MCGRFTLRTPAGQIVEHFLLSGPFQLTLRFNIAPTQDIPVVISDASGEGRWAKMMRWGLVPSWAADPKGAARLINARSESIAEKPSFRTAFRRRRCLIPADGYYEWMTIGKRKQPFHIRRRDGGLMAFAGLWEVWFDPADDEVPPLRTCTIITTPANETTRAVHDRMPAILPPDVYDQWLTADAKSAPEQLQALLKPADESFPLALEPVNPWVNNARHEGPECLTPMSELEAPD